MNGCLSIQRDGVRIVKVADVGIRGWPHAAPVDARSGAGGERGLVRTPSRWLVATALVAVIVALCSFTSTSMAWGEALSQPVLVGPIGRTTTTIGVRFFRSAESGGVCRADIGYEFRGGAYLDWHDAGTFPDAPCEDPDPGYKFSDLAPGMTYELSIRAYRIVNGVKTDYSAVASMRTSTLASPHRPTSETRRADPDALPPPRGPGAEPAALVGSAAVLVVLVVIGWVASRGSKRF